MKAGPSFRSSSRLVESPGLKSAHSRLELQGFTVERGQSGSASSLVDRLIEQGFTDVSVLDVSPGAIGEARQRLPPGARVDWLVQDVLSWRPARLYSLWHDRAVFHFLVAPEQKEAYRRALDSAGRVYRDRHFCTGWPGIVLGPPRRAVLRGGTGWRAG